MSDEARRLLVVAQELARLRNAEFCDSLDVALAAVQMKHAIVANDSGMDPPSTSPQMLRMSEGLEKVLTGQGDELGISDLIALAVEEQPQIRAYLAPR